MESYLIGIAGNKQVGKDTTASMINYIFSVGATKASYIDYVSKNTMIAINNSDRIIHFADNLKDICAILYNIPRSYFDDTNYKDNLYFCPATHSFVTKEVINGVKGKEMYYLAEIQELTNIPLASIIKYNPNKMVVFKLRTLLQYIGTDVFRKEIDNNIWVSSGLYKMIDIAKNKRICIVPDIRFPNEAIVFYSRKSENIKSKLIRVTRPYCDSKEHISERGEFRVDETIDNDSTKAALFYKVLDFVQRLIKE